MTRIMLLRIDSFIWFIEVVESVLIDRRVRFSYQELVGRPDFTVFAEKVKKGSDVIKTVSPGVEL